MKTTFKQFMLEGAVEQKAAMIAKGFLGNIDVDEVRNIDDALLDTAKEEKHEFLDSAAGKWIISLFKARSKNFARVNPPRGEEDLRPMYFIPKEQS